ncbi:MAG: substrate-binding domain-containing protein [Anaerolineae bacterium]|nr:substrate-binding domain-containing protein [Anaerolineae bacterium]
MPYSSVVGIVAPDYMGEALNSDYYLRMLRGLENELALSRRKVLLFLRAEQLIDLPGLREWIEKSAVSGIVNITSNNYAGVVSLCQQSRLPCVQIDHHKQSDEDACPTVKINNRGAILAAVDHLVDIGHRRIGMVTGRPENPAAQQRLEGYKHGLQYAHIPFEPGLCRYSDANWDSGHQMALELLSLPNPPTALIAFNDTAALAMMAAIRSRGLEPGRDVSVIGFDDMPFARESNPPLTTIRQPIEEIARQAAHLIGDLIDGCLTENERTVETALIIRRSTGPIHS